MICGATAAGGVDSVPTLLLLLVYKRGGGAIVGDTNVGGGPIGNVGGGLMFGISDLFAAYMGCIWGVVNKGIPGGTGCTGVGTGSAFCSSQPCTSPTVGWIALAPGPSAGRGGAGLAGSVGISL